MRKKKIERERGRGRGRGRNKKKKRTALAKITVWPKPPQKHLYLITNYILPEILGNKNNADKAASSGTMSNLGYTCTGTEIFH